MAVLYARRIRDMGFQEPLPIKSANMHPTTVLHDPVLEKSDHMVLLNPVQDATFKRQSSSPVSPYAVDEAIGDLISPTATKVESISQESKCEDDKADEQDKNESFSIAMITEMETSIYGLQIIKNVDFEELRELGSGTYGVEL
ncbi:hypothetical protein COP2_004023 [Malus domestica]